MDEFPPKRCDECGVSLEKPDIRARLVSRVWQILSQCYAVANDDDDWGDFEVCAHDLQTTLLQYYLRMRSCLKDGNGPPATERPGD
jgi:hypothetical protein